MGLIKVTALAKISVGTVPLGSVPAVGRAEAQKLVIELVDM